MKILTNKDIKFDENNMYIASHTNLYENLQEKLTEKEFNIYMSHLIFLEFSLNQNLVDEDGEIFTFVELEDVSKVAQMDMKEAEGVYEDLINKGYIKIELKHDRLAKYFRY